MFFVNSLLTTLAIIHTVHMQSCIAGIKDIILRCEPLTVSSFPVQIDGNLQFTLAEKQHPESYCKAPCKAGHAQVYEQGWSDSRLSPVIDVKD